MKRTFFKNHLSVPFLAALIVISALLGLTCGERESRNDKPKIEYETQRVKKGNLRRVVRARGKVVSQAEVEVKSRVSGEVLQVHCDLGSVVNKGDLLADIPDVHVE